MANIRMVVGSLADQATLSATHYVGAMLPSNLQLSRKENIWRSTSIESVSISGTFSVAQALNCFVLAGHNISSAGLIRLKLRLNGQVIYDSGDYAPANPIPAGIWRAGVDPFGSTYDDQLNTKMVRIWLPELMVTDEFEVTIQDPNNPDGYVEASRLLMGQFITPDWNLSFGGGVNWVDTSQHILMEGGCLETAKGILRRQFTFSLDHLSESDRIRLEVDLAMRGKSTDVFVSLYPEEGGMKEVTHMMIARRDNDLHIPHVTHSNWASQITFIES